MVSSLGLLPVEVVELDAVLVVLVHDGGEGDDTRLAPAVLQLLHQQVRQQEAGEVVHLPHLHNTHHKLIELKEAVLRIRNRMDPDPASEIEL